MGKLQPQKNKNDPRFRCSMINSSKSFVNGSKPIIRNNLGLCKCSEKFAKLRAIRAKSGPTSHFYVLTCQ